MKRILLATFLISSLNGFTQGPPPCTDLFISEYIEGTSNNKAIELYNPTSNPIDLAGYNIKIYFNGSITSGSSFFPIGIIGAGQTFTIANSLSTIFTGPLPDTTVGGISITSFNGDDVVILFNDTTAIDIIGILGVDPGTNWPVLVGGATSEFTLVRKPSVHNGYTSWTGSSDTSWVVHPQNTTTFFGSHTINTCPVLPVTADFNFTTACFGNATNFANTSYGGTPGFTYNWNFGDATTSSSENPSHIYLTSGCFTVQLIVTDTLLNDDTISQLVCVTALDDPMVTTNDSVLCNTSFGMFLNADDSSGTWGGGIYVADNTNGDGFFSSSAIPSGTYYAIYTTSGLCPNADTVIITVPVSPTVSFTYSNVGLNFNFNSTATGTGLTYNWTVNGTPFSTLADPTFTFTGSGSYNVCVDVSSDSSCTGIDCQTIVITGIGEMMNQTQIGLFPNPANNTVNIEAPINTIVEIRNLAGQLLTAFTMNKSNTIIDIATWPAGVYSVVADKTSAVKLVVVK
jgi:PKD repeat protein